MECLIGLILSLPVAGSAAVIGFDRRLASTLDGLRANRQLN